MRVTKTMKEVIEQKLSEKRIAADKAARAEYEATRKKCIDECYAEVENARCKVAKILIKYGMDTTCSYCGENVSSAVQIVNLADSYIKVEETLQKLRDEERARYQAQRQALQEIIFDAEAGGDKDSLLAAIAAVQF